MVNDWESAFEACPPYGEGKGAYGPEDTALLTEMERTLEKLLPWLETYTFPVEARYGDTDFAEAAWKRVLNRMWANGTLRFTAFATIHKEAAWRLMELTEQAGLSALIGKVNMDRNAPDSLREDTDASLADTEELICRSRAELKHVEYILTPRFVPSTTT